MKNRLAYWLFRAAVRFNRYAWRTWQWSERMQSRAQDAWMFGDRK